jgi:outer membrane protein assembly factor BamB
MRRGLRGVALVGAALALLCPLEASCGEWSQWRGGGRDGRADGVSLPSPWPDELPEEWRAAVGEGHSSPIASRGKLFVLARQGEEEVVLALDPATGKQAWRASYGASYEMDPAARSHGKGPKSTPVEKEGRLFTLGINGVLSSFESATGALRWRKDFAGEYKRTSPLYGTAMSPLVEDGLVVAHVGGHDGGSLAAFEAESGRLKWSWDGDGPGYASPIVVEAGGGRQLVTQSQTSVIGVSLATGDLLWRLPYRTPYDQNSVTPIAWKGLLVISGLDQGVQALDLGGAGGGRPPREVWRTTEVSMYMSSPVIEGDVLHGFSHRGKGEIFSMDSNGRVIWRSEGGLGENAAIVSAGGALLALTNGAELIVFKPGRERMEVIARRKVAASPTWAHPLLAGGRLYVKDRTSLICYSLQARSAR